MTNKRYPVAIDDLLTEFDEMDYCPTNLCNNPEREAKIWKENLIYELDLILDEKTAIERRAVEKFAEKFKEKSRKGVFRDPTTYKFIEHDYTITESELKELLKEYENDN